ncbi:putative metal-dependent hydrolase [Paenibacillus sp. N3/727]|uniref:YfiT family bacillithiol transferase n=1 Tax=Paenibacillus sp. N3/727 TaxID=2925845 RepID=UPI001F532EE3|nr:putative metal-dependent hydrolase [Paenibacillus sp. N3/727]UNK16953.1 putative metal-dependent hydrolase [Paenibacillus sp. N3/727]
MERIRFPLGHFEPILNPTSEERKNFINQIPDITITLRNLLKNLEFDQVRIPYRPDGWTIQQIVHHLADNDMNAYLRFKRALTEDEPLSDSYREDLWAELNDYREVPIETSISLLEILHSRFLILLNGLNPEDYNRKFRTQVLGKITLDTALQRFVWHNQHHMSQIKAFIDSTLQASGGYMNDN